MGQTFNKYSKFYVHYHHSEFYVHHHQHLNIFIACVTWWFKIISLPLFITQLVVTYVPWGLAYSVYMLVYYWFCVPEAQFFIASLPCPTIEDYASILNRPACCRFCWFYHKFVWQMRRTWLVIASILLRLKSSNNFFESGYSLKSYRTCSFVCLIIILTEAGHMTIFYLLILVRLYVYQSIYKPFTFQC